MHSTNQDRVNQETSQPERTFVVDAELQVEETIASLKQHFEEVRHREVKRTRGRLGELSLTQEIAIDTLSRGIIDQILNTPMAVLRASYGNSHVLVEIATVHRIFKLGEVLLQVRLR
jgi:glutamyl-tRNA reductase